MATTASFLGLLALTLSSTISVLAFGSEAEYIGHWDGTMSREGVPLQVSFDFKGSGSHPNGTFTSFSQAVMDYPLDVPAVNGSAVRFARSHRLLALLYFCNDTGTKIPATKEAARVHEKPLHVRSALVPHVSHHMETKEDAL